MSRSCPPASPRGSPSSNRCWWSRPHARTASSQPWLSSPAAPSVSSHRTLTSPGHRGSNQFYFATNKITFYISKQKEKYCNVMVTWHILCHLPVTPKHKLQNDIYMYVYILIYTHLHENGLGKFKKCVKMCENPNSVSF